MPETPPLPRAAQLLSALPMSAHAPVVEAGVVGFSHGGPKWSKGKSPPLMKPIQHLHSGLPAIGRNLNPFQLQTIYSCMEMVQKRFPSAKDRCNVKHCQAVADEWNRGHELPQIQHGGSVGCGGRITDKHAMAFLQAQGLDAIGSNAGVIPGPVGCVAAQHQPLMVASMPSMPMQVPAPSDLAMWRGAAFPSRPFQNQSIEHAKKPEPAKKPRLSLPDGCDPNLIDHWNSRELERTTYEFGGVQRGSVEIKRIELRRLLAKNQKKAPSSSKS